MKIIERFFFLTKVLKFTVFYTNISIWISHIKVLLGLVWLPYWRARVKN